MLQQRCRCDDVMVAVGCGALWTGCIVYSDVRLILMATPILPTSLVRHHMSFPEFLFLLLLLLLFCCLLLSLVVIRLLLSSSSSLLLLGSRALNVESSMLSLALCVHPRMRLNSRIEHNARQTRARTITTTTTTMSITITTIPRQKQRYNNNNKNNKDNNS